MLTPCPVSPSLATILMAPQSKSASTVVSGLVSSLIFLASAPIPLMVHRVPVGTPGALRETRFVYPGYFHLVDSSMAAVRAIKTVGQLRNIVGERFSPSTAAHVGLRGPHFG